MAAVSPLEHDLVHAQPRLSRREWLHRLGGLTSVVISSAMTVKYMTILHAYVQNDYFWTNFNASGAQTFVADVFNSQLWNTTSGPRDLPLFSIDAASEKDYSKSQTLYTIQATDTRRIVMEQLNNLPVVIAGLRSQTTRQSARSLTCYCWLDFDRAWDVAHTAARQARCHARYINNGAVFMESMLRNTEWTAWNDLWGLKFQVAYGSALQESAGGMLWLNRTTTARSNVDIATEIEYWIARNVTQYVIPWQNRFVGGFDNSILVQTAIMSYAIPVNHVQSRSISYWTSGNAAFGVWNDLLYAVEVNASLVRNASNSFTLLGDAWNPEMWNGGYPDTPWSILFHDVIGPFASVDLMYNLPPPSLVNLYTLVNSAFLRQLQSSDQLNQLYEKVSSTTTFDMVPPSWIQGNVLYYGGNPLCYTEDAQTYVQESFGFDDACTVPFLPLTLFSQTRSIILALLLQSLNASVADMSVDAICALNQNSVSSCRSSLQDANVLLDSWRATSNLSLLSPWTELATNDVVRLNISLMQYATVNLMPIVMLQPILDDSNWSFYGWLQLIDWLEGTREVIAFEGDANILVLMSYRYPTKSFVADPLEIPNRLTHVVWLLLWYMCLVSSFVTLLAFACGMHFRDGICFQNLYFFNPVVGIVWIGRPFVMLRGLTAIVLLSSTNVLLQRNNIFTHFVTKQRTFLEVFVVSGETIWLTHAINDVLSMATRQYAFVSATLSCGLVWAMSLIFELLMPVVPVAVFDRTCVSSNMDIQLSCTSGVVQIGSFNRFVLLCAVQCVGIGLSYGIARILYKPSLIVTKPPVIIPAVATSYLTRVTGNDHVYFDACTSVLCGIIPCHFNRTNYMFSVVLWVLVSVDDKFNIFRKPNLRLESAIVSSVAPTVADIHNSVSVEHATQKIRATASIFFFIGSAVSSALFFYVVQDQLSNDFLWAGFNATGIQPFLIDEYNTKMVFHSNSAQYDLIGTSILSFYNSSLTTVSSSGLYSSIIQFEQISLVKVVEGLRVSNACQLPWISTQYCWVDFDQKWEMANSMQRQNRCQSIASNAAIYIEAILRNANMYELYSCWGEAIEIGIFNELQQSTRGEKWIASLGLSLLPAQEVAYWISKNITQFVSQWQNFKSIGIVETVDVQSAHGLKYPLTLKTSAGSYRYSLQTSMKMYWGWGSDLWMISQNDTLVGQRSLIRSSANFAFANVSLEAVMVENKTLSTPLDAGLAHIRSNVGPYGSIDLVHIPRPPSLLQLYNAFTDTYTNVLELNASAQTLVAGTIQTLHQIPTQWLQLYSFSRGGSVFCPITSAHQSLSYGLLQLFESEMSCDNGISEITYLSLPNSVLALSAWDATRVCSNSSTDGCPSVSIACSEATTSHAACKKGFGVAQTWAATYMAGDKLENIHTRAQLVQADIALLSINIVQYAQMNASAPVELLQHTMLTSGDVSFDLMSWLMLIEWVTGNREAISILGDFGTLNVLSSTVSIYTYTPNPLEIPAIVSYYCQLCIQYTTAMVFLVTFFSLVYAITCRLHVEGLNMFEINRVGGIVWVGRPLLVLRSLIAILFLATSTAQLHIEGNFTKMITPKATTNHALSTVLAGSETCWLVIVLTDLFMVVTKDHTNKYSLKSSIITTMASIILSWVSPVTSKLIVSRACDTTQVDFQLVCHAGIVQIGSFERTLQLVIMTSAIVFLCFAWERWRHPTFKLPSHHVSLLLPAGAHYLYHKRPWIFNNTLYLDKASAFLCGLVSVKYKRAVYVLDIKTWRIHRIDIDSKFDPRLLSAHMYDQNRIEHALPMVE
ncbi:Aste57867_25445 [Aphanomyces stellatus]|uniref:Aste57867_25445 protein n=1 Tax=Aphanomyces stellatus TaxID=120398 RepID=A0A485LUH5_9STRA|nr:hypothetical protein As57867_025366 [Aphanomyces stellatus]VFU02068.1 Aste57867_25445 [Aphanomyces stellatus]